MKQFYSIPFMLVLQDIVLNEVSSETIENAERISIGVYEFIDILTGAPPEVDYAELGALAREELVRYLEGDHGNPGN